jgi:hypothetical protein
MSGADYFEGLLFFLPMAAGTLAGAWLLLRRRFAHVAGAARVVAFGQLAVLGLLAIHLTPLVLGVLTRGTVLVATGLWLLAARLFPQVAREREPAPAASSRAGRAATAIVLFGGGLLIVYLLAVMRSRLVLPPVGVDVLTFHMPTVVSWIKTQTIWQIPVFLPDVSPGHYPNNGDVLLLAAVLPWSNDFLGHLVMYPVYVLTGVATYAVGRELRVPAPAAAMAGLLPLAMPAVTISALVIGLVDALSLFALATGVLFLIRHHRNGIRAELVLAGLALGVSFGTKWYAVAYVPIVVAVWAAASMVAGRSAGEVARKTAALVALVAVGGGIWLLRNLVESGNPVHPVKVEVLGVTIFDAPHDEVRAKGGSTLASYIGHSGVWGKYILPQLRDSLGLAGFALLLGVIAGGGVALVDRLRGRAPPLSRLVLAGSVLALLIIAVYSILPYTAGGPRGMPVLVGPDARYVVPALMLSAPIAAWAAGRLPGGMTSFAVLGIVGLLHGVGLTSDGRYGSAVLTGRDWATGVAGLLVLVAAIRAAPWLRERLRQPRLRVAAIATAATAAMAVAGVGHAVQQRYNDDRYLGADPTLDWLIRNAPEGRRIGLAGLWSDQGIVPILPAFGPRFGNDVAFVGKLVEDTLNRYGTRPTFTAAVARGDFDYLIVGRGRPGVATPPERAWARRAGYELLVESDRLSLFRVRPTGRV